MTSRLRIFLQVIFPQVIFLFLCGIPACEAARGRAHGRAWARACDAPSPPCACGVRARRHARKLVTIARVSGVRCSLTPCSSVGDDPVRDAHRGVLYVSVRVICRGALSVARVRVCIFADGV